MKNIFTVFILLTLISCSAYEDWDQRGPETPALREQRTLILPPNFKEEAPVTKENSESNNLVQKAENKNR